MSGRAKMIGWFLGLLLLFLIGVLAGFFIQETQRAFDIGDLSHVNVEAAEVAFEKDKSNNSLVLLIKALCFRREVLGEREWEDKLVTYGRELYARARNEEVDLQTVDDEKIMLQVLSVLRDMGAHR